MAKYKVTIEETFDRDVEVQADSWDDAFEKVERVFKHGGIDMRSKGTFATVELGSDEHEFFVISQWQYY